MNIIFKRIVLLFLASELCLAAPTQSIQAIQENVDQFVRANLDPSGDYQISIAKIDPHLQIPACDAPLTLSPQSAAIKPGLNTIAVRCNANQSWTIYSIVTIKAYQQVLVSTKPLLRNESIHPEHLTFERRDVGSLQQGYLSNLDDVINKLAVRNIAAGTVLARSHYSEMAVVKRGERVNIQSGRPGFLISAPGVAMMDGIKGQQIRVKNASSHRIVQAVVINPGLVTVSF
jgi:flagella basal body P-ring formation protein FlgA